MPNLFIIAGPNGAGKTTYARRFLPEEMRCREFVNADMIAAGLSPFAPDRAAFEAGRIYDNSGSDPYLVAEEKDGVFDLRDAARLALIEQRDNVRFMPEQSIDKVEEPQAMSPSEETRRSMRAMRKAYADVILENLRYGLPVIQWREGRGVVEVPPEQLEPFARRILEVNGEPLSPEETRALLSRLTV